MTMEVPLLVLFLFSNYYVDLLVHGLPLAVIICSFVCQCLLGYYLICHLFGHHLSSNNINHVGW